MKKLHRPIPKSKLLEGLKKHNETNSMLSTSNVNNKSNFLTSSPNVTKRAPANGLSKSISRKSFAKKPDTAKPQTTIRSLFDKQMEKSRVENSQAMNSSKLELKASDEQSIAERSPEKSKVDEQTSETCLMTGPLHKRLTRRNSMTMHTPTKKPEESATPATPASLRNRRCTIFTPSKPSIDEEEEDDAFAAETTRKSVAKANQTVDKSIAMDICNEPKSNTANKCNNMVRQLLNTDLLNTPRDNGSKESAMNKFAQPKSNLRRRTTYTPQAMDETKLVQVNAITPISSIQRRQTMNPKANATPVLKSVQLTDALMETKSCDAVLTPTNKIAGNFNLFLFHLDFHRSHL